MGQPNVPVDHIDLTPGPTSPLSNPNEIRLTMAATGVQASVNGAAPAAVGGSVTMPTFGSYFATMFQNKTGLSPLQIVPYISNFTNYQDNAAGGAGSGSQGGFATGTGALVAYSAVGNGIITLTGPTVGAGEADITNAVGGGNNQISNARTKKWLVAGWVANGHAPVAASQTSLGILVGGTTYAGLGFVGAVSTWRYVRGIGGSIASIADTGATIDSTDAVYKWFYIRNDGTSIIVCFDVLGGGVEQTVEAATNLASATAKPYFTVQGAGASDKLEIAGYCCFSEF